MDFVFEVILEIIMEFYIKLMTLFIPEEKLKKSKVQTMVVIEMLILLALSLIGGFMLLITDSKSLVGKIMVFASLAVIVFQIAFGIVMRLRKKEEK